MAHILLIDDNATILELVRELLGDAGHAVESALDGAAAIEKFAQGKYDVVITDIFMPGEDGIGTIRHIRRHDPHVGIIAVSGGGQGGDAVDVLRMAAELGADFTLAKPLAFQKLLVMVALANDRRRARERCRRAAPELGEIVNNGTG